MLRLETPSRGRWIGVGLIAILASTALGYLLNIKLGLPVTFLAFFPAILGAAWHGGRRAGVLVIILAMIPSLYFLPPRGLWKFEHSPGLWAALAIFVGIGGAIVDLTARVRAAIELRDALLSIAGHDIKQPLGNIVLETELLRRKAKQAEASPEEVVARADRITRQVDELRFIVQNLLDIARTRSARFLLPEEMSLSETVRAVVDTFSGTLASRGYALALDGVDREIRGVWDRTAVERIVANLLSNAIKYGDGKPLSVSVGTADGRAWLVVRDHGRGIPPEDRRTCFDAFRRGRGAGKVAKGHGLGLWIVKTLVTAHRGTVGFDPAVREGTALRVELPLRFRKSWLSAALSTLRSGRARSET